MSRPPEDGRDDMMSFLRSVGLYGTLLVAVLLGVVALQLRRLDRPPVADIAAKWQLRAGDLP